MSKKTVYDYDTRHEQFLKVGARLVKGDDVSKVTAAAIARTCKCTAPLVFSHFKDRDALRDAVRKYVKSGNKVAPVKVAEPKAKKPATPAPKKPIAVVKAIKNKAAQGTAAKAARGASAIAAKKVAVAKPSKGATSTAKKSAAKKASASTGKASAKKTAPPRSVGKIKAIAVPVELAGDHDAAAVAVVIPAKLAVPAAPGTV